MILTGFERMRAAVRSPSSAVPPVILIATSVACQHTGTNQATWCTEPRVLADTLIEFRDMSGCDGIYVTRDNLVVYEAMGGCVDFPENDEAVGRGPVLKDLRDFRRLAIPDPRQAPGMRTVLAAAEHAVAEVGDRYYVMANIDCGPFSTAANLRGVQSFLLDIVTEDPVLVEDYLGFCTELVVAYGKAMQQTGVHGIQYGDSTASLINPWQFERFALPYLRRSMQRLRQTDCDLWLHICGKTDHLLPLLEGLEIDVFEVDSMVPMTRARELLGGAIALKGNLDTVFLQDASPDEIYRATRELIQTTGRDRLIVSAGCMVPRFTPLENVQAMCNACHETRGN